VIRKWGEVGRSVEDFRFSRSRLLHLPHSVLGEGRPVFPWLVGNGGLPFVGSRLVAGESGYSTVWKFVGRLLTRATLAHLGML